MDRGCLLYTSKLGFGTVVLPEVCRSSVGKVEGINLVYVSQIRDADVYKRQVLGYV